MTTIADERGAMVAKTRDAIQRLDRIGLDFYRKAGTEDEHGDITWADLELKADGDAIAWAHSVLEALLEDAVAEGADEANQ